MQPIKVAQAAEMDIDWGQCKVSTRVGMADQWGTQVDVMEGVPGIGDLAWVRMMAEGLGPVHLVWVANMVGITTLSACNTALECGQSHYLLNGELTPAEHEGGSRLPRAVHRSVGGSTGTNMPGKALDQSGRIISQSAKTTVGAHSLEAELQKMLWEQVILVWWFWSRRKMRAGGSVWITAT